MKCAWKELLDIVPQRLRGDVDKLSKDTLQELRLRLGRAPELVCADGVRWLEALVTEQDIAFTVNTASRYSPWAAATAAQGYLTAPGGHRVGLCGTAVSENGLARGMRDITGLNIRVARDFPELARGLRFRGNLLILGPPGSGKTTLLRALSRELAWENTVTVIDERMELFPQGFSQGRRMDVLLGAGKAWGIEMALRCMGPRYIAVDEITAPEDCEALICAAGCGVELIATAHASCARDLYTRPVYRSLVETELFDTVAVMCRDKSWHLERMNCGCTNGSARY